MAFREVSVVQVKEALRRWLRGEGERPIARAVGVDSQDGPALHRRGRRARARPLGRRGAAHRRADRPGVSSGCARTGPTATARPGGRCWLRRPQITAWVKRGPHGRQDRRSCSTGAGSSVPHRTLARFAVERCGAADGARSRCGSTTRRRAWSCQVDFGRLGLVADGERRRVCHALIFTAVLQPPSVRVADVLPDTEDGDRGASRRPGVTSAACSRS